MTGIENILILDTETGGLDARVHSLLEIGMVLYNVPHRTILMKGSSLIPADYNAAMGINNIDTHWCNKISSVQMMVFLDYVAINLSLADLVIAHNSDFDRRFIEMNPQLHTPSKSANWACSRKDIKWPSIQSLKLQEIARHYGVDYTKAHRASDDCEILLECLLNLEDFEHQVEGIYHKKARSLAIKNMAENTQ